MRRQWPIYRMLLGISFVFSTCGVAYLIVEFDSEHPVVGGIGIAVLVVSALVAGGTALGLGSFYRQMLRALRALKEGEFDEHIETVACGEMAELIEMINNVTVQLKQYDDLRANRTAYANRAMYTLLSRLTTPAMIVELPANTGRSNQACQRALDLSGASVNVEFILRHAANEEFADAFRRAFELERRETNIACTLRIAPSSEPREVDATFVPIKGESDDVQLGLILLTMRAQTPAARKSPDTKKKQDAGKAPDGADRS